MNHKLSTIMLIFLGGIGIITLLVAGTDTGIWNDEELGNTVTQSADVTNYSVCIGETCWGGYQLSIENNASINGSPICTPENLLCNELIDDEGHTGGTAELVSTTVGGAFKIAGAGAGSTGGGIDFGQGRTAAIGISRDGVYNGYDYDGTFVLKQAGTNPDGAVEFLFIEENGDWRFALPTSGPSHATSNPRSMIIAGPSINNESQIHCDYWFDDIDCDTSGTGADLGVQDDLEVGGTIYAKEIININGMYLCNNGSVGIITVNETYALANC